MGAIDALSAVNHRKSGFRAVVIAVIVAILAVSAVYAATVTSQQASSTSTPASSSPTNPLCTSQPCAPMITGWLHTVASGTDVYDSSGSQVPLVGVDVDGLDFGTGNPASAPDSCGKGWSIPATSFANVASWGFNSVRIPISWENIEPTAPTLASNGTWIHHWNTQYLEELDTVVSQFGKTHIVVIFDFAQVDVSGAFQQAPEKVQGGECEGWGNPTWLYPGRTSPTTSADLATAMCNFFNDRSMVGNDTAPPPIQSMEAVESMLAGRYSDNSSVVGIDMFNEPWFTSSCGTTAQEGALLTSFYTKMGQAISKANPHLLLIFEDSTPGLMPSSPVITAAPSVPNTMYEFHIYTSDWTTAQPYVSAFLDSAKKFGVPVWMGEFDAFEAGCTGVNCKLDPNWEADTEALLSFSNANDINWAYFSYYSLGTPVQTPVPHSEILEVLQDEIPQASSVAISCKPSSVVVGSPTTCKATVFGSRPTGSVSWTASSSNGKFSRESCVISRSSCSVSYTPTSASSTITLFASYSGDSRNPARVGTYNLALAAKTSKVEMECKPSTIQKGSSALCSATVTGYFPTGMVSWSAVGGTGSGTFSSGTCTLTKGRCSVNVTGTGVGIVTVQAVYSGNLNNTASSVTRDLTIISEAE